MDCDDNLHETAQETSLSNEESPAPVEASSTIEESDEPPAEKKQFENLTPAQFATEDVIYEGGIPAQDDEEVEFKVIFEEKIEPVQADGNDVDIEVRGVKYRIPYAIECHLCNEMMNLCLRRTRYRGEFRDYPAYRCNRKGCQTFRSIRKVFQNCVTETDGNSNSRMVYQPSPGGPKKNAVHNRPFVPNDTGRENPEFVIQRVYLPKPEVNEEDPMYKTVSISERVRRANQARAAVFSEFADQLRRDIAANKRVRVKKQPNQAENQQGTLFYISKELNPHEVVEVQDAILKTLLSLRKISTPMHMHDLPLFANCPFSKASLEAGLASPKHRELFWGAVTNSPQPPLPKGFIKRKDDTLIYKNPNPYTVPDILRENSPRKQVVDTLSYQQRKGAQDLKRIEKRHNEKKIRSWTSLKREFDMAETDDCNATKMGRPDNDSSADRADNKYTLQEIISKMENTSKCRMSGTIRSRDSDRNDESMQWIDDQVTPTETHEIEKKGFEPEERHIKSMDEVMKNLSTPPIRVPMHTSINSFSSTPDYLKSIPSSNSSQLFPSDSFNNHIPYTFNPYLNSYPSMAPSSLYQSRDLVDEQYLSIGASEVVQTEPSAPMHPPLSPFTYIHPHSGVHLTDPSVYLTTFVPSPVTKAAPTSFADAISRCSTSEPSTSCSSNISFDSPEKEDKPSFSEK